MRTRLGLLSRPALFAFLLGFWTLGCGDIDGGQEPFAGTTRYQDLQGRFELRLLVPPWIPIPPVTGDVTIFVVMPDAITTSTQEADARYSLDVTSVDGEPAAALRAAAKSGWPLSEQQPVTTVSGATGVELSWQEGPTVYHREVFLAAPAANTFYLHFTAKKPIASDEMITQMILSFTPRGTVSGVGVGR